MTTDPRFDVYPTEAQGAEKRRSKWASCLIGCLVVLGVLLVLAILIGVWVARNWRDWAATGSSQVLNEMLDDSELPPPEKAEVKAQADRITTALRDGLLSLEQVGILFEKVMDSPLMPAILVAGIDKQYLQNSGLSEEEKAQGRTTMNRFARGIVDKKIDEKGIDAVMAHVADRQGNGQWKLRNQVSDADLRAALNEAKSLADAAGIAAEPEKFDPSHELKKIIDEILPEST